MRDRDFASVILYVAVLAILLALALGKGCSDGPRAAAVLKAQGYDRVVTDGWSWSCGGDSQCTGFRAVGPNGAVVEGAVGCGWVTKGCTVRVTGVFPPPQPGQ